MRKTESGLLVAEYGGTPRSGKGTIVGHLGKREGVATDETGADYRAITRALIEEGKIEPDMPEEEVRRRMANASFELLTHLAASRKDIVEKYGFDSLYEPDVQGLVHHIAKGATARKAVKEGFKRRVELVRDDDEHSVLAVDGRNLSAVIDTIEGTRLFMRTFVSTTPLEATWRECLRKGISLESEEAKRIFQKTVEREKDDANRALDPVKPEDDAIEYWYDQRLEQRDDSPRGRAIRLGAGALAAVHGQQIHFDTTYFRAIEADPKEARSLMLEAADRMFTEAHEVELAA